MKSAQKITVYTGGIQNVDCRVDTSGNSYRVIAPGTLEVERTSEPLVFRCEKAHYLKTEKVVKSKATSLNYAYPESVMISMTPDPKALNLPVPKVREPGKRAPEIYKDDDQ